MPLSIAISISTHKVTFMISFNRKITYQAQDVKEASRRALRWDWLQNFAQGSD